MSDVTADLASRINEEHRAAVRDAQSALMHAREAGRLLQEAKGALPHGTWGTWLAENVEFSERSAQGYMRVAARWAELEKTQRVADLSLRGALALLSEPRPQPEEDAELPFWLPARGEMSIGTVPGFALWIVPDANHEGFYYYALITGEEDGEVIGGARSLRGSGLHPALDGLEGFAIESAEWLSWPVISKNSAGAWMGGAAGWTFNELLFGSHEEYVQTHVLGRPRLEYLTQYIHERWDRTEDARRAFIEIRDHKLYRETHDTFEEYVREAWHLDPEIVNVMLAATETEG